MKYNFNIKEFDKQFKKNYNFLYENRNQVAGYYEAVREFDNFVKLHGDFVGKYADYRKDYISSDRESAAFMFTVYDMIGE